MSDAPPWLRKINAYITAAVGLAVLAVLVVAAIAIARDWLRYSPRHGAVATEPGAVQKETMAYTWRASSGDLVVLDLVSNQRIEYGLSSKELSHALRNQRFIRIGAGSQADLFAHDRNLIVSVTSVAGKDAAPEQRHIDADRNAVARVYAVVTRDTNTDGRLSSSDAKTLMIAAADGTRLTTLAEDIETASHPAGLPAGEVRILVTRKNGQAQLVRFDVERWQPLAAIELPQRQAR